ncbi:MAG: glycosyltransferase [Erysipelotrichaceae bacterium]|nr:glycosyltransferase [Erysipelotrichaceae bacterium]
MRIGLFSDTYTPDINGVVSSIVTLQKELEKNGHEVFIITNHKALITTQRDGNVLRLPGLELKWLYGYKLSTPYHFSARDEIKKMNLDVIHVHTEFGVGMFGRIVGRYLNIPVVSTYHTMYEDYTHYINRFEIEEVEALGRKVVTTFSRKLSAHVQALIAPSVKTKETLINYGVKTPIYVIPTGLDLDKFEPANMDQEKVEQCRQACGLQKEDHIILYVGRIAKEKSIEVQIEGFRYIDDPHIKLLIVGGGPQLDELKQLAKSYGIEQKVIFTGAVSREEVPVYYALGDAFVSASLTETQGMTYIEAMASHLPVFARPDDVLRDLIIDELNGYLFETPKEFAQKVQEYLKLSDEKQGVMRAQARKAVVPYDGNMFYSKVMSVYYQAIDDYEDAYEVIKVKALEDHMRIYVINDKEDEPMKIFISLDDYFNLKIRKSTLLDRSTVEELLHKEQLLLAYRGCIRKLRLKDYTTKEMKRYVSGYASISEKECAQLVDDLVQKGYLDDYQYMMSKIDKMQYSLQSKGKIIRTLVEKGIPHDDIAKAVAQLDDEEEREKAIKIAEKLKNSVKDKSQSMKRNLIAQKLIRQGFDSSIARNASEQIEFEDNDEYRDLCRVIEKAYRVHSRKYKGSELKNKIIRTCMQKGFHNAQIMETMEGMEWYHEEMDQ